MAKFRIGLGVTGGIAAYKAAEVLRLLQKSSCDVQVAMTAHATEFIQPLTFRALTGGHVIVDDYDPENADPIAHINFSQDIDLLLVVPATANIIAKFASGIADDFLSSTYLATTAPVLMAPAMNSTMWEQPATRRNVESLKADGVHFVEPIAGELACKTVGTGKLEDVENIVEQALRILALKSAVRDLARERFLITVGGTREAIDPVRFISNHSSGKMGFALAAAASDRGAGVTMVAGVTSVDPPPGIRIIEGISAKQMHEAVMTEIAASTIFIGTAAVADYAPTKAAAAKIKKGDRETMSLELTKTPDILAAVAEDRHEGLIVVGFAAETNDVIGYAREKMMRKGLDIVVANDITKPGAGFNTDTNIATVITKGGEVELTLMSKREMADRILDEIVRVRKLGQPVA